MAANALQAVLDKAARDTAQEAPSAPVGPVPRQRTAKAEPDTAVKFSRPSRENRKFIGGHFDQRVGKQLRLIAAEDSTTVQALLEEALDLLFIKKGRQTIGDIAGK